ncbi:MAG: hypothetical protein K0S33_3521 [Bacteroidetes bacterium]|jgi:hypothetical protein|nr:hypothetical protein [Bacteroidota bacterium]
MSGIKIYTFSDLHPFGLEQFLLSDPLNIIYCTPNYISLLERITGAPHKVLAKIENAQIKGFLPFMEKAGPFGKVINSLPYYGSHGGAITGDLQTEKELMEAFVNYCQDNSVISATLIPSFFKENTELYSGFFAPDFEDERIGQFVNMSEIKGSSKQEIADCLMEKFHSKTRGHIRKAIKSDVTVRVDAGKEALGFLKHTHEVNCKAINIVAKTDSFFYGLHEVFEEGKDFNIYTAWHEDKPIAAMLCLYYNKTIEYYCPATIEEFRVLQPLSLLAYSAMIDGVDNGYTYWNWGGTSLSAQGVYDFKARWGTTDKNYKYFTRVFDKSIYKLKKEDIMANYPYFFVIPFNKIQHEII